LRFLLAEWEVEEERRPRLSQIARQKLLLLLVVLLLALIFTHVRSLFFVACGEWKGQEREICH